MTTPNGIVAVTEQVNTAGAITYWRLSGDVATVTLAEAWEDAGLDPKLLPGLPGAETALRRAMHQYSGPHRLVRPLRGEGFALVAEETPEDDLKYAVDFKAKVAGETVTVEPSEHPYADSLQQSFDHNRATLTTEDISVWLTKMVKRVGAVQLRDTGGMYFVPRQSIDTWRAVHRALKAASAHTVYEIPALRSEEAVEAILDAVQAEAEKEARALEAELEKGLLTARGLKGRASKTEQMLSKIQGYEGLLGQSMDALKKRIEDLKASITVAIFQAEEEVAA